MFRIMFAKNEQQYLSFTKEDFLLQHLQHIKKFYIK